MLACQALPQPRRPVSTVGELWLDLTTFTHAEHVLAGGSYHGPVLPVPPGALVRVRDLPDSATPAYAPPCPCVSIWPTIPKYQSPP